MVRGAKGGHTPVEDPNTLRSTQRAAIVDVLGEGPIGGLVNGLQSVFFDGVPVENADGSRNVEDFAYAIQLGGPTDEGRLAEFGFDDVQAEVSVGVEVRQTVPVVRSINDPGVNAVRVTINVPQLLKSEDDGDMKGAAFTWAIEVQSNGGGYVERYRGTVDGKCTTTYSKAVRVDLAATGPAPWDVRVRRITADSTDSKLQDKFYWSSYTRISSVRMLYRHSAAIGQFFDAKNFSQIPVRLFDLMGFAEWEVPTNYNPLTRTYSGTWNGTFKLAWTNNPAWVFRGIIVNDRFGLGTYIETLPDKWTLYQLSQWCDGQVSDGRGGFEPRYCINAALTTQVQALKLLQDIASLFRGIITYGAGEIGTVWDAPGEPVALYAPANVVDSLFNYSDGSLSEKKSSCTVWYNDLAQLGKRTSVTWDDPDLVAKYGLRRMQLDPIGCTSPSQALRHAKWGLYSVEYEDNFVGFRVGEEGAMGRLGEVFAITDPSETGERLGGRVLSGSTATLVKLDAPVELLAGETYTLWCIQPDPDDSNRFVSDSRPVSTGPGVQSQLALAAAFAQAPTAQSMWILEANTVAPTLWRYVSIEEVQNGDSGLQFDVVGVRHEPGKWAAIEGNQPLQVRPTRRLPDVATSPINLTLTEVVAQDGQTWRSTLVVGWEPTAPGLSYIVAWRYANGTWTELVPTRAQSVDIGPLNLGTVQIQVRSRNVQGNNSEPPLEGAIAIVGNAAPAADVDGLALVNTSQGVLATWNVSPDFDYAGTELRLDGANPAAAAALATVQASYYNLGWPSVGVHNVWARHLRRGGPPGDWTYSQIDYTGPAPLLNVLDGLITEEQLEAGLNDRLDLIDGDGPGSVNVRLVEQQELLDLHIVEQIQAFGLVGANMVIGSGFDRDSDGDGLADSWVRKTEPSDPGRVWNNTLVAALNGSGYAQRVQLSSITATANSGVFSESGFGVQPSTDYVVSVYLRTLTAGVNLQARIFNSAGTLIQSVATPDVAADGYAHRVQLAFTSNAAAATCKLWIRGARVAGDWFEADAVQFQTGEDAGPYAPSPLDLVALSAQVAQEVVERTTADTAFAASLASTNAQVATNAAAITAEQSARSSEDAVLASSIATVQARLTSRPNLLPNGGFSSGLTGWENLTGWAVEDGPWGRVAKVTGRTGTITLQSALFPVSAGEYYVITGDSELVATGGSVYFDLLFYDAGGGLLLNGPQVAIAAGHTFSDGDVNRSVHAVQTQAPASSVSARARFVGTSIAGVTSMGCRQVKVEHGQLPATPYTAEGGLVTLDAAVQAETQARIAGDGALASQITTVQAQANGNTAAIATEATARANADSALSTSVSAVQAQSNSNAAAIIAETNARTSADSALSTSISSVQAQTASNASAIIAETNARTAADSALAESIETVQARLVTRPNLLSNGGFERGLVGWSSLSGWTLEDGEWGRFARRANPAGTGILTSDAFEVQPGSKYVISGDTALSADGGTVYLDILFYDGSGALLLNGPEAPLGPHFFSNTDANRAAHAVEATAPTGAVTARARFVWSSITGGSYIGLRQVKVERGPLPYTPYSAEGSNSALAATVQQEITARVDGDGALASQVNTVQAQANSNTAAIQTEATTRATETGQLSAQWSVKVDANGRWAGIITRAGGNKTTIDLLADVVRIGSASIVDQALFAVYSVPTVVNGITLPAGVYVRDLFVGTLNGSRIIASSITGQKIAADTLTTRELQVGSVTAAANDETDLFGGVWPAGTGTWTPDVITGPGLLGIYHLYGGGTLVLRANVDLACGVGSSALTAESLQANVRLVRKAGPSATTFTELRSCPVTQALCVMGPTTKEMKTSVALNFQFDPGELTVGQTYYFGLYVQSAVLRNSSGAPVTPSGSDTSIFGAAFIGSVENKV